MASEVLKVSHTAGVTNSESVILNGVNGHTYVILSILVTETAGAAETFDLYLDDGGGGTDYEILSDQALAANATFEFTSKLVLTDEDHLCAATASGADVDIVVSYLDITRQVHMSGIIGDNTDKVSGVISSPTGGPEVRSDNPSASHGVCWFTTADSTLKVYRNIAAWSAVNALNTGVYANCGAGTISAALSFGGYDGSTTAETEEWDGTNWSTSGVGNLASARRDGGGFGTQTAAVAAGGNTGSASNSTEEYDGSSWSSGGNLNESFNESKAMGTETAGLRFGGET